MDSISSNIRFSSIILFLFCSTFLRAQKDALNDWERTFMPAIQMGYAGHGSDQLSGGIMIQTSLEYRDVSNFVFRLNYDDFTSNMEVAYPIDQTVSFTGRVSFVDFIGGVGYRENVGRNIFTLYVQGGIRNYGYPEFTADSNQVSLDFDSRNIGIMRYSLGYEYALTPKLFLTLEGFVSHTLERRDFWADNPWSYGVTIGISAPLF